MTLINFYFPTSKTPNTYKVYHNDHLHHHHVLLIISKKNKEDLEINSRASWKKRQKRNCITGRERYYTERHALSQPYHYEVVLGFLFLYLISKMPIQLLAHLLSTYISKAYYCLLTQYSAAGLCQCPVLSASPLTQHDP